MKHAALAMTAGLQSGAGLEDALGSDANMGTSVRQRLVLMGSAKSIQTALSL
jgi:hypothetical protein